jgi:predicted thioesterase
VGESVVGTAINIRHLAATPLGHQVTAEAQVTGVDGRRIVFNVRAFDEHKEIGSGTHERIVVDRARFDAKLALKMCVQIDPDGCLRLSPNLCQFMLPPNYIRYRV